MEELVNNFLGSDHALLRRLHVISITIWSSTKVPPDRSMMPKRHMRRRTSRHVVSHGREKILKRTGTCLSEYGDQDGILPQQRGLHLDQLMVDVISSNGGSAN